MKTIESLKSNTLIKEETNKIFGGESTTVNVGNTIVDDLNGLIR